ncbi:hypothetical protein DFH08DRAFT_969210 [Mycena albidolilacea]|uniref:UBC core domain-containing protein n=1 Tax=Mycena albidolilacea TaxID=1033008 RepID=A0AAD6ZJ68_9AGAR|nr:hypothetical protein DFH08DRAFT_969210 [Mycena albidolilacea]
MFFVVPPRSIMSFDVPQGSFSPLRSFSHPSRATSLAFLPSRSDAALFPSQLCTRYCLVCHNKLTAEFEALKPYVCDHPLRTYQYYAHNRGVSLEYEIIHSPETVDLLVSLCYSAAAERVLDEPLPKGMALRVPPPDKARITTTPVNNYQMYQNPRAANAAATVPAANYHVGLDGLVEFDQPPADDMGRHLERTVKPRLKKMETGASSPRRGLSCAGVASCTAYLEEMSDQECTQGVGAYSRFLRYLFLDPQRRAAADRCASAVHRLAWRQPRFSVGAPDAEATFQIPEGTAERDNGGRECEEVPKCSLPLAFLISVDELCCRRSTGRRSGPGTRLSVVGCAAYQTVANGRAFGDSELFSLGKRVLLAYGCGRRWGTTLRAVGRAQKSKLGPTSYVAPAEVVNLPKQFVSSGQHFVVKDTGWIVCRYLLIKGLEAPAMDSSKGEKKSVISLVKLDPAQTITLMSKALQVPQPGYQIGELVQQRRQELRKQAPAATEFIDISDDEPIPPPPPSKGKGKGSSFIATVSSALKGKGSSSAASGSSSAPAKGPPKDDWKHNADYVRRTIELLMPLPFESSPSATMAVQRELKRMLKEQNKATTSPSGLKELGNVNSLIFEIRFPPTYPIGPPFFRIITPRFLPFMHGGGVTSRAVCPLTSIYELISHFVAGGSICMDLLTSDGWLPSYSISAVLMQIKRVMSTLDLRPARLASNWNTPYPVSESLVGFKRAAATYGWTTRYFSLQLRNSSSIMTLVRSGLRFVALLFLLAACPKFVDLLLESLKLAKMFCSQPFYLFVYLF